MFILSTVTISKIKFRSLTIPISYFLSSGNECFYGHLQKVSNISKKTMHDCVENYEEDYGCIVKNFDNRIAFFQD